MLGVRTDHPVHRIGGGLVNNAQTNMTRDEVAQSVVRLLREIGAVLDDVVVQRVREIMAPVAPPSDPDVLDRGGAEPQDGGTTSEQGYIGVVEEELTIREQVR